MITLSFYKTHNLEFPICMYLQLEKITKFFHYLKTVTGRVQLLLDIQVVAARRLLYIKTLYANLFLVLALLN